MEIRPRFDDLCTVNQPFPHFTVPQILDSGIASDISMLLQALSNWALIQADFYEQFETSVYDLLPTNPLRALIAPDTIAAIADQLCMQFKQQELSISDATLHRLVPGQSIGLHNDYIPNKETHRLIIHFSRQWEESNGGYFVLFDDSNAERVSELVKPVLNSAIGFEISERSHHAISQVYDSDRYSVVYSFSAQ